MFQIVKYHKNTFDIHNIHNTPIDIVLDTTTTHENKPYKNLQHDICNNSDVLS